jgi:heme-degrading monooxygenase HmoA
MIARAWRGATRAVDADDYLRCLRNTGLADYERARGNRGVLALRRLTGDRAEFLLISLWESDEAVRAFAGEEVERAVFYPEDDRFLIERGEEVAHYDLVFSAAGALGPAEENP